VRSSSWASSSTGTIRPTIVRQGVVQVMEAMGLAPMLVQEIFDIVSRLNREEGVPVLLAEQNASMTLRFAQYAYVMESGRIVLDGDARTISENEDVKEFPLGLSGVGHRKS
jgi:branched-chain amino acid transport system ATP-binding protein